MDASDVAAKPRLLIAIDGPAGSGKSTLAAQVAQALGLSFLDSGAMFRAVAWKLGGDGAHLDSDSLRRSLEDFSFSLEGAGGQSQLLLNGAALGPEIRTEEVGKMASAIAKRPEVRAFQKAAQQAIGRKTALVAEGRDMGTVVFPQATHKFFLEASVAERARRRAEQLAAMGHPADEKAIAAQIEERDRQDRERPISPLRAAADAVVIDTTAMTLDEVCAEILRLIGPI